MSSVLVSYHKSSVYTFLCVLMIVILYFFLGINAYF